MLTIMRISLIMICCVGLLHAKLVMPVLKVSTQQTHQGQEIVINNPKKCEMSCAFSLGSTTKLPRAEDLVVTTLSHKNYVILTLTGPSCEHEKTNQSQPNTFLISDIFSERPLLWEDFKNGTLTLRLKMEGTGAHFDITTHNFAEQQTIIHAASAHPQNSGSMR